MATHLIVLAAGLGTRMKSHAPKVLHPLGGAPLLHHALAAGETLSPERVIIVAGHGAEEVEAAVKGRGTVVRQAEQLGTAHAVAQARQALDGAEGDALVLYGDTPFIRPATLERMAAARAEGHAVVVLGFEAADPARYGRLIMDGAQLDRIVEWKDASDAERAVDSLQFRRSDGRPRGAVGARRRGGK